MELAQWGVRLSSKLDCDIVQRLDAVCILYNHRKCVRLAGEKMLVPCIEREARVEECCFSVLSGLKSGPI
mgnify:CR=1 FL=1